MSVTIRLPRPGEKDFRVLFTMRSGDLAPDNTDLGSTDLLLATVDVGDLLAQVEAISLVNIPSSRSVPTMYDVLGGLGVIDTLDLDQAGPGVGVAATTLIAQVATPNLLQDFR